MKKLILIFILLMMCGCGKKPISPMQTEVPQLKDFDVASIEWPDYEIHEITEKMFIGQINDVYYNYKDYQNKYIKYEGIFITLPGSEMDYRLVMRYGPGCCADDGFVGFQVYYEGTYPKQNEWVEVIGLVKEYEVDGANAYVLHIKELTIKDKKGKTYVDQ